MKLEEKKVLITVKAYPNPSKKHQETVCCAGIDLDTQKWIRLFPVPFRFLGDSQKFKKYNIINVKCHKAQNDRRVESFKIDQDSIEITDYLDSKDNWKKRKDIVSPTISSSFCKIKEDIAKNKSLGVFKPCDISFSWKEKQLKDEAKREAAYAQLSFFDSQKKAIEQIPFDFYYHFKCYGKSDCPGHKLLIIDWELGQSYRSWRYRYKTEEVLLKMIEKKWFSGMCSKKHDTYFYVGNQHRFQEQFMVLGVLYPQK